MNSFNFNILRTFHVTSVVASLPRNLRRRNASSNDGDEFRGPQGATLLLLINWILVVVLGVKKSE